MVGPIIQDNLFAIITRFRVHTYILTADVAKMYRQINLHPDDRKYWKILWRETRSSPIKTYELTTMTYGTSPASFLAIRALRQLADDEQSLCPETADVIKRDFYIDDLITGTRTYNKAVRMRDGLIDQKNKGDLC